MTSMLRQYQSTYQGQNFDGERYFATGGLCYNKVIENNASNDTLASPLGKSVYIKYNYQEVQELTRLLSLFFYMRINNSSATESPTIHNPYALFEKIEVRINNKSEQLVFQRAEMIQKYNEYLLNSKDRTSLDYELFKNTNLWSESTTLAGLTVPVSSYLDVRIDLLAIMPDIFRNHVYGAGVAPFENLEITLYFSNDTSNADVMTEYVVSNTTVNAWSNSTISFSNLKFVREIQYTNDRNLTHYTNLLTFSTFYKLYKTDVQSWNTPGTNYYLFRPSDDKYSKFNAIQGFSVMIRKSLTGTAFNQADACKYYAGPKYIGFEIKLNDVVLMDMTGSSKLHERIKYLMKYVNNRFDTNSPQELLTDSSNLNKYYLVGSTYIDMANIKTEAPDAYAVAMAMSTENKGTRWEIKLTCESSIGADVEIMIFFHVYASTPGLQAKLDYDYKV